jgi:hypothetical protein
MLKKYGAGLPHVVCALAPAQSTLSANRRIAVCAGRAFDGIDKLATTQISLIKENRIVTAHTNEVELVQFVMKDGHIFKNEPNDGDLI